MDDFFNIHNTIHVLLPSVPGIGGTGSGTHQSVKAVLVNGRLISNDCRPGASNPMPPVNDSSESSKTLDQWYGDTSPMSNTVAGADTLNCRTFNTFQQRSVNRAHVLQMQWLSARKGVDATDEKSYRWRETKGRAVWCV